MLILAVAAAIFLFQGAFILLPVGLFLRLKHIDNERGKTLIIVGVISWAIIIVGLLVTLPVLIGSSQYGD